MCVSFHLKLAQHPKKGSFWLVSVYSFDSSCSPTVAAFHQLWASPFASFRTAFVLASGFDWPCCFVFDFRLRYHHWTHCPSSASPACAAWQVAAMASASVMKGCSWSSRRKVVPCWHLWMTLWLLEKLHCWPTFDYSIHRQRSTTENWTKISSSWWT